MTDRQEMIMASYGSHRSLQNGSGLGYSTDYLGFVSHHTKELKEQALSVTKHSYH